MPLAIARSVCGVKVRTWSAMSLVRVRRVQCLLGVGRSPIQLGTVALARGRVVEHRLRHDQAEQKRPATMAAEIDGARSQYVGSHCCPAKLDH